MGGADDPIAPHSPLSRRQAVALFESMIQSRLQDLLSRELKDKGLSYYTIGSSGHEANAVLGSLLRTTDPSFLHYRSGAFMAARLRNGRGETPFFDAMLSFMASAEDPVSGDDPASHPLPPQDASNSTSASASIPLIILMKAPAISVDCAAARLSASRSAHSRPWG